MANSGMEVVERSVEVRITAYVHEHISAEDLVEKVRHALVYNFDDPAGVTGVSLVRVVPRLGQELVTHGRHCTCSACAREDWTNRIFTCGMHGSTCPPKYQPLGAAGTIVAKTSPAEADSDE